MGSSVLIHLLEECSLIGYPIAVPYIDGSWPLTADVPCATKTDHNRCPRSRSICSSNSRIRSVRHDRMRLDGRKISKTAFIDMRDFLDKATLAYLTRRRQEPASRLAQCRSFVLSLASFVTYDIQRDTRSDHLDQRTFTSTYSRQNAEFIHYIRFSARVVNFSNPNRSLLR